MSFIRSGWGNWHCLIWRRGSPGETLFPSITARKEIVVRLESASSLALFAIELEETASSWARKVSGWMWGKNSYLRVIQALEWASQEGVWITIPGGIQEEFRCCTKEDGLEGNIVGMWMVRLDVLGVVFQLWRFYYSVLGNCFSMCQLVIIMFFGNVYSVLFNVLIKVLVQQTQWWLLFTS